jgi:hypothetical protein
MPKPVNQLIGDSPVETLNMALAALVRRAGLKRYEKQ